MGQSVLFLETLMLMTLWRTYQIPNTRKPLQSLG